MKDKSREELEKEMRVHLFGYISNLMDSEYSQLDIIEQRHSEEQEHTHFLETFLSLPTHTAIRLIDLVARMIAGDPENKTGNTRQWTKLAPQWPGYVQLQRFMKRDDFKPEEVEPALLGMIEMFLIWHFG